MRSKKEFIKLSFACCFIFLFANQVETINETTPATTTTAAITTPKVWETCNIGKGSKREEQLLEKLSILKGKR